MEFSNDNEKFFSRKSINSYNIIINNKIMPTKNKANNIDLIKKCNNFNYNNKSIFTMAGRTCQEQKEIIKISSKMNNINKSRSVSSLDFNMNNPRTNKYNKIQRLNQQEKLEILHKINQRSKIAKSSGNKEYENIYNFDNVYSKSSSCNFDNCEENRKNISSYFISDKNELDRNNDISDTNRLNTCMNDSSKFSYICKSPSLYDTKSNLEINDYAKSKINEIKNDLLLFKSQIKKELKDEVKNEIRAEIKKEFSINYSKKRPPSSSKIVQSNNNYIGLDDEIYYKKTNKNYFIKNKERNKCSSEEKFIYKKENINLNSNDKKEKKSFNPKIYVRNNNNEEKNMKEQYRENYEKMNDFLIIILVLIIIIMI
jgi:hypothetical protein